MRAGAYRLGVLRCGCLVLWAAVICAPIVTVFLLMFGGVGEIDVARMAGLTGRTFGFAAVIAIVAVVLGYAPGRLVGSSVRYQFVLLLLILLPLVLPRYVLYYCWTLLFNPATEFGRMLASRGQLGRFAWAGRDASRTQGAPRSRRPGRVRTYRLRRKVAETPFNYKGENIAVTISIGLVSATQLDPLDADNLISTADKRLYRAKQQGRNRVIAADE